MQTEGLWGQTAPRCLRGWPIGPDVLSLTKLPFLSSEMQVNSCHYPGLWGNKYKVQTDLRDRLTHIGSPSRL